MHMVQYFMHSCKKCHYVFDKRDELHLKIAPYMCYRPGVRSRWLEVSVSQVLFCTFVEKKKPEKEEEEEKEEA